MEYYYFNGKWLRKGKNIETKKYNKNRGIQWKQKKYEKRLTQRNEKQNHMFFKYKSIWITEWINKNKYCDGGIHERIGTYINKHQQGIRKRKIGETKGKIPNGKRKRKGKKVVQCKAEYFPFTGRVLYSLS